MCYLFPSTYAKAIQNYNLLLLVKHKQSVLVETNMSYN